MGIRIGSEGREGREGGRVGGSPARRDDGRKRAVVDRTTCCVVGGGPAGVVLALLLARKGVEVTLLEAHHDFDREFRGDTIHPSVMEIMDQIGLADRLLELRHTKVRGLTARRTKARLRPSTSRT